MWEKKAIRQLDLCAREKGERLRRDDVDVDVVDGRKEGKKEKRRNRVDEEAI